MVPGVVIIEVAGLHCTDVQFALQPIFFPKLAGCSTTLSSIGGTRTYLQRIAAYDHAELAAASWRLVFSLSL